MKFVFYCYCSWRHHLSKLISLEYSFSEDHVPTVWWSSVILIKHFQKYEGRCFRILESPWISMTKSFNWNQNVEFRDKFYTSSLNKTDSLNEMSEHKLKLKERERESVCVCVAIFVCLLVFVCLVGWVGGGGSVFCGVFFFWLDLVWIDFNKITWSHEITAVWFSSDQ